MTTNGQPQSSTTTDRPAQSNTISQAYRSVQDIVFSTLKDEILSGALQPGASLNTLELSKRLGVSRTPIREALNRLEAIGLVDRERHRGVFVRRISMNEMVSVYCIRAALFGICSRLAARRLTNAQKHRLFELCEKMEACLHPYDYDKLLEYNAEFHGIISEASGSADLKSLIEQYYHRSTQYRALSLELKGRGYEACREHRQIVEALTTGDPEAAEYYSREHYFTTARRIAELLGIEIDV